AYHVWRTRSRVLLVLVASIVPLLVSRARFRRVGAYNDPDPSTRAGRPVNPMSVLRPQGPIVRAAGAIEIRLLQNRYQWERAGLGRVGSSRVRWRGGPPDQGGCPESPTGGSNPSQWITAPPSRVDGAPNRPQPKPSRIRSRRG